MLQSSDINLSIDVTALEIRRCSLFITENKMYRNKFIQWSLLVVFIASVLGLNFRTQGTLRIFSVKAASQTLFDGDLSVIGPPSLPAASVDTILKNLGSPMSGLGQVVAQASQQTNIDDAFALAVWWTETNDGAAGVGLADRNPGSVRGSVGYPSAFDGYTIYPSYAAAIMYWFNMLKNMYVNRGLSTVYLISHPYVGTSSSPLWAGKVVALMLKYRGEAPPVPIVVPHGKRVTEPSVYIHITPTPTLQQQQAQSQPVKLPQNHSSIIVGQVNNTPIASSAMTNAVVFFALLLALVIVACVLWLEKRSGHTMVGVQAYDEIIQVEGELDEKWQDMVMQGGGKPRSYYIRSVRPFRHITLYALQDENAPNTDALISTAQEIEMDTVKTDAIVMLAQEMNTGANFHIRRKIFLPSTPITELAKSEESTTASSQRGRSTGLLSRYGETHQE